MVKLRKLEVGEYTGSNPYSTGVSGTQTEGYLWPLSTAEALELQDDYNARELLKANDYWWLRSPGNSEDYAAVVHY